MAVSIVENWTDLEGEVLAVEPVPDMPSYRLVEIGVSRAQTVAGFANLLSEAVGTSVRVHVPVHLVEMTTVTTGVRVACRVRRAGPHKIFAHPDLFRVRASR
ncbi:hypothetical protein YTPLAS18_31930 [Nitrospira sp.]|nr:hypothetical protein YTPLAS18_31930 [Nitrospira sp.]